MSRGCRHKRVIWASFSAVALIGGGCHWLPRHRVNLAIDPRSPGVASAAVSDAGPSPDPRPGTLASRDSVPLPALPLQPISDEEVLSASRPTPILDAALVRAQALDEVVLAPETPAPRAFAPKAKHESEPESVPELEPIRSEPVPPPNSTTEPEAKQEAGPRTESAKLTTDLQAVPAWEESTPEAAWGEGVDKLRRVARALHDAPGAPAEFWELRGRLLDWLAEPLPDEASDPSGELWPQILSLLATASEADPRAAAMALEARAPLEVTELRLCHKISGFGNFEPLKENGCQAGAVLLLYCEMAGVHYEAQRDQMHSRLESRLEILPEKNDTPIWKQNLGVAEDFCRRARRDYYVNYRITLPGLDILPPGSYRLHITQHDLLSGDQADHILPLAIVGEARTSH